MYVCPQVVLYREGVDGAITVDGTDVRLGRSPGDAYTGLDVINLPLYVGGVPRDMVPRGILGLGEVVSQTEHLYVFTVDPHD